MCFNCDNATRNFNLVKTTCRVCELVDGDTSNKGVVFCDTCSAYICESCWTDGIKRAKAVAMNWGQKIVDAIKGKGEDE